MPVGIAHRASEMDHTLGAGGDQEIRPRRFGLLQAFHLDPFRVSVTVDEPVVPTANRTPTGILHLSEKQFRDHLNQGPWSLAGSRHPPQPAGILVRRPAFQRLKGDAPFADLTA